MLGVRANRGHGKHERFHSNGFARALTHHAEDAQPTTQSERLSLNQEGSLMQDPLRDVAIPATPCRPARCSLAEWYEEAQQLDHLRFRSVSLVEEQAKGMWESRGPGRYTGRDAVLHLVSVGYPLDAVAQVLGVDAVTVAGQLARSSDEAGDMVRVERMWRAHPEWHIRELARQSGVPPETVRRIAAMWGAELPDGRRRGHDEATPDQILDLRQTGMSYGQIARLLNVKRSYVAKVCQRQKTRLKAAA